MISSFLVIGVGCNQNEAEKNQSPFLNPKLEYQKAMNNFAAWREFVKCPIDEIIIETTEDKEYLDEYDEENDKAVKVKNECYFEAIKITDSATIKEFVRGMQNAQYNIIYNDEELAVASGQPWARIIFKSKKQERSIWVFSFGYSVAYDPSRPYMFSSRPLTAILKKIFLKTHPHNEWDKMASGDGW